MGPKPVHRDDQAAIAESDVTKIGGTRRTTGESVAHAPKPGATQAVYARGSIRSDGNLQVVALESGRGSREFAAMTAGALAYRRSLNLSLRNSGDFSIEHPVTSLPRGRRSSKARAPLPPPPPSPPPMSTRNSAASAPNGEARARRVARRPAPDGAASVRSSSANGEPAAAAAEEPTFAGESVCELSETARQHLLRMLARKLAARAKAPCSTSVEANRLLFRRTLGARGADATLTPEEVGGALRALLPGVVPHDLLALACHYERTPGIVRVSSIVDDLTHAMHAADMLESCGDSAPPLPPSTTQPARPDAPFGVGMAPTSIRALR